MAKILIIDDDALNRELVRMKVEPAGHKLVQAADGDAGYASDDA